MKEVKRHLNSVSTGLISDAQISAWLNNSKRSVSLGKAKRARGKTLGVSTRKLTAEDRTRDQKKERGRNERATAAEKRAM